MPGPQRPKQEPCGYEPDPWLAKQQIMELIENLNKTVVKVVPNIRPLQHPDMGRKVLLSFSPMQEELRRLVEQWKMSGPNLRKMFSQNPELKNWAMHGRMCLWPTPTGRGHLAWHPATVDGSPESSRSLALELFIGLIANPNWESLGGPCARCGNYFLKKTKRQKVYCSRDCGSGATARSAIQRKRQQERDTKISLAQQHIERWHRGSSRLDWKEWVSIKTHLTPNWLTRAVNKGMLRAPRGVGTSAK